jgi:hypothetical protein
MFGPYPVLLARMTARPEVEIERIAVRLRDALIWKDDLVDSEAWDKAGGQIAFLLDTMVGAGQLERRWSSDKAAYSYRITELGYGQFKRQNVRKD